MPRRDKILGDVTQAPRGTVRNASGASGSGLNDRTSEPGKAHQRRGRCFGGLAARPAQGRRLRRLLQVLNRRGPHPAIE